MEDYFQEHWDYPGKYYTVVAIPSGYKSRRALVDTLVRDTLSGQPPEREPGYAQEIRDAAKAEPGRRNPGKQLAAEPNQPPTREEDPFYQLLAEYPDLVVDYCIVQTEPDCGYEAHRRALKTACVQLCKGWNSDPDRAVGKPIDPAELFSSQYPPDKLNYRKAFLYPPHENRCTGKDFVRVNAALFPKGTAALEAWEWTTDWSDCFDEGHEWWGALCLTVWDKAMKRFVVILASATD